MRSARLSLRTVPPSPSMGVSRRWAIRRFAADSSRPPHRPLFCGERRTESATSSTGAPTLPRFRKPNSRFSPRPAIFPNSKPPRRPCVRSGASRARTPPTVDLNARGGPPRGLLARGLLAVSGKQLDEETVEAGQLLRSEGRERRGQRAVDDLVAGAAQFAPFVGEPVTNRTAGPF